MMVLFHNINAKARVEVLWQGVIYGGTVRYTGVLVARTGDWIGVELDRAVSDGGNGLHHGVQYFTCRLGHGIFTSAKNIRFKQSKRTFFNNYRTISSVSSVDMTLFQSHKAVGFPDVSCERELQPSVITSKYLEQLLEKDSINKNDAFNTSQKGFHKSHLVGNHIRPSTASRPSDSEHNMSKPQYNNPFISPPSISATHVPRPSLKRMMKQNYFGTTIPRYTSLS